MAAKSTDSLDPEVLKLAGVLLVGVLAVVFDTTIVNVALDKLALETDLSELGRFITTRNRSDIGAFKTEQLRNVGITAPYMHDGSLRTLWDVVDHYNKGGETNPYLDGGIEPLDLSESEIDDLVAFLFTLTDSRFATENEAAYEDQKALAAKQRPFRENALAHRQILPFETRVVGAAGLKSIFFQAAQIQQVFNASEQPVQLKRAHRGGSSSPDIDAFYLQTLAFDKPGCMCYFLQQRIQVFIHRFFILPYGT